MCPLNDVSVYFLFEVCYSVADALFDMVHVKRLGKSTFFGQGISYFITGYAYMAWYPVEGKGYSLVLSNDGLDCSVYENIVLRGALL